MCQPLITDDYKVFKAFYLKDFFDSLCESFRGGNPLLELPCTVSSGISFERSKLNKPKLHKASCVTRKSFIVVN